MSSWRDSFNEPGKVIESERLGVATTDSELRRMYVDENMSCGQIADELGVSYNTARRFCIEAGISMRDYTDSHKNERYRDEAWLKEQYIQEGRTMTDIADECGVVQDTISKWLGKFGIEKRDRNEKPCKYRLSGSSNTDGYPTWTATGGTADSDYLTVHRLVAIADGADPHRVFSDHMSQVHHRNGFKCDNRPQNLEVVDSRTHGRHHTPDAVKWTDDDLEFAIRCMMNPAEYIDPD